MDADYILSSLPHMIFGFIAGALLGPVIARAWDGWDTPFFDAIVKRKKVSPGVDHGQMDG